MAQSLLRKAGVAFCLVAISCGRVNFKKDAVVGINQGISPNSGLTARVFNGGGIQILEGESTCKGLTTAQVQAGLQSQVSIDMVLSPVFEWIPDHYNCFRDTPAIDSSVWNCREALPPDGGEFSNPPTLGIFQEITADLTNVRLVYPFVRIGRYEMNLAAVATGGTSAGSSAVPAEVIFQVDDCSSPPTTTTTTTTTTTNTVTTATTTTTNSSSTTTNSTTSSSSSSTTATTRTSTTSTTTPTVTTTSTTSTTVRTTTTSTTTTMTTWTTTSSTTTSTSSTTTTTLCPGVVKDPTGCVVATCSGGVNNPIVSVRWCQSPLPVPPAGTVLNSPPFALQKGDCFPNDPQRTWDWVPNSTYGYTDGGYCTPFVKGQSYSYRVKWGPGWPSYIVQVPITTCNCGP